MLQSISIVVEFIILQFFIINCPSEYNTSYDNIAMLRMKLTLTFHSYEKLFKKSILNILKGVLLDD